MLGTVATAADIHKEKINENTALFVHVWIPSTSPHAKNKELVAVLNSWEIKYAMITTMCADAIGMVVIAAERPVKKNSTSIAKRADVRIRRKIQLKVVAKSIMFVGKLTSKETVFAMMITTTVVANTTVATAVAIRAKKINTRIAMTANANTKVSMRVSAS